MGIEQRILEQTWEEAVNSSEFDRAREIEALAHGAIPLSGLGYDILPVDHDTDITVGEESEDIVQQPTQEHALFD